jgi:hypothetical protein
MDAALVYQRIPDLGLAILIQDLGWCRCPWVGLAASWETGVRVSNGTVIHNEVRFWFSREEPSGEVRQGHQQWGNESMGDALRAYNAETIAEGYRIWVVVKDPVTDTIISLGELYDAAAIRHAAGH